MPRHPFQPGMAEGVGLDVARIVAGDNCRKRRDIDSRFTIFDKTTTDHPTKDAFRISFAFPAGVAFCTYQCGIHFFYLFWPVALIAIADY